MRWLLRPSAPFSLWELSMNIESIQTANLPQKAPARDAATPVSRQTSNASAGVASNKTATTNNTQRPEPSNDKESVENAVQLLSSFVSAIRPEINFSIDETSGTRVVKIIDSQSRDVIRQIPSEEAIQLAQALDKLQGLFLKDKA